MEHIEVFERQVAVEAKNKALDGRPPTRLQRQAPASLQVNTTINSFSAPSAIPLLSPLVISPPPLPETEEFMFPTNGDSEKAPTDNMGAPLTIGDGWQHPAVAGYTEPSVIFALFQSRCVVVNQDKVQVSSVLV